MAHSCATVFPALQLKRLRVGDGNEKEAM